MIHIFHGEHIEISRKELSALKAKFKEKEIVVLDGKTATLTQLTQATESLSLFGSDRLIVIENLLSKKLGRGSSEANVVKDWIKKIPPEVAIVFWEEKELGKTILNIFPPKTDIAVFKPDKTIFSLVESIRPGNRALILKKLHLALYEESAEMIFAMLVRQLRFLIMAKDLGMGVGLSPWQATKLIKQAEHFTMPQLLAAYKRLFVIDDTIKSGKSPYGLRQELEIFLLSL